jgi:hypothetical protein
MSIVFKVLHFNPVAVDTEALREIRDHSHDQEMREAFVEMYQENTILPASQAALALGMCLSQCN